MLTSANDSFASVYDGLTPVSDSLASVMEGRRSRRNPRRLAERDGSAGWTARTASLQKRERPHAAAFGKMLTGGELFSLPLFLEYQDCE